MILITKPYLPSREKLDRYLDGIYERAWVTNNGPLVQELTRRLEAYLGVENLLLVANGTLALQVACRALDIVPRDGDARDQVVTTPFTFAATASSLKWEGCQPVFADIEPAGWALDPLALERSINERTRALAPVHVFGNACDVECIDGIARREGLKVVYDGAHAFGADYKGRSLLRHGDATTLSFHGTKLFHTIEGGAVMFKRRDDLERARKIINFGLGAGDAIDELGINAKMSEFHAAVGLCVLDEMQTILKGREAVWRAYQEGLEGVVGLQERRPGTNNNYAYFPILLKSAERREAVLSELARNDIMARRYFHPSLDRVPVLAGEAAASCPVSGDIAGRVLCLPVYTDLDASDVRRIVGLVKGAAS